MGSLTLQVDRPTTGRAYNPNMVGGGGDVITGILRYGLSWAQDVNYETTVINARFLY